MTAALRVFDLIVRHRTKRHEDMRAPSGVGTDAKAGL
jgi:hypothetical protein